MREYLIVETRDAADHRDAERALDLARGLSRAGSPATILLTENGAFNARRSHGYAIGNAIKDGVALCVDSFALEERGIREEELKGGISVSSMDSVVDHLINGSHVIWR
jgi:predicted peroxiredoxin